MVMDGQDPAVLYLVSADQPDLVDLQAVTGQLATSRITAQRVRASIGFVLETTGIAERVDLLPSILRCTSHGSQVSVQGELCGNMFACCVFNVILFISCLIIFIVILFIAFILSLQMMWPH